MKRRGLHFHVGAMGLAATALLLLGGCVPWLFGDVSDAISDSLESQEMLGGNSQRLVFMRYTYPGFPEIDYWTWLTNPQSVLEQYGTAGEEFLPTTEFSIVDRITLTPAALTSDALPTDATEVDVYSTMSDGRRLAWLDRDAAAVRIYDLETGQTASLFDGLIDDASWIEEMADPYLVASTGRGSETILLVYDFDAARQTTLLANLAGAGVSLSGDRLAIQYYPALLPQNDGIGSLLDFAGLDDLLASNVDLIDLETLERTTVLTDLPRDTIAVLAGDLIWVCRYPEYYSVTSVQVHDLTSGQTQTVLELPSAVDYMDTYSVEDVGASGAILYFSGYVGETYDSYSKWELLRPDGQRQLIVEQTLAYEPFSFEAVVYPWPRFVQGAVVYEDPAGAGWIVYDPATDSRRTFEPFE